MLSTELQLLERRLSRYERRFFLFDANSDLGRHERWFRLEGLLSQSWQSWCAFCRSVLIQSCLGTTTVGGMVTIAAVSWVDAERVSYEAKCFAYNGRPKPNIKLSSQRDEITWGDVNRLTGAIIGLSPSNVAALQAGFGGGLIGPKHMQLVRNAAAHLNGPNITDVRKLAAFYSGNQLNHPTDMMRWLDIQQKVPAFVMWLADLRIMAAAAVQ